MSETQRIFDAASIDDEGSQLGSSRAPNNTYLNLAVFRSAQRHLKDTPQSGRTIISDYLTDSLEKDVTFDNNGWDRTSARVWP